MVPISVAVAPPLRNGDSNRLAMLFSISLFIDSMSAKMTLPYILARDCLRFARLR